MKLLISLLFLFSIGVNSVQAGNTELFFSTVFRDHQQPVEQQSPNFFYNSCLGQPNKPECHPEEWVYNPTDCDWDLDDRWEIMGVGNALENKNYQVSLCVIADQYDNFGGSNHRIEAFVVSSRPNLLVSVFSSRGLHWDALPVISKNETVWKVCLRDTSPEPYPIILDSNGGTGYPVYYTLNIAAANRTVRDIQAIFQTGIRGTLFNNCSTEELVETE